MFTDTPFLDCNKIFQTYDPSKIMNAELLFSFLMFFQVQLESIRESGFYKLLEEKYPEVSRGVQEIESEEEIQQIMKLTGMKFDDLKNINITVEGLEGITKIKDRGPKIGSELDLLFSAELDGKLNSDALISYMLDQLQSEKGIEERKQVEKSKNVNGNVTFITIPAELIGDENSASDILFAFKGAKSKSEIFVGVPKKVNDALKGNHSESDLKCIDFMAKNRQVTFALKVDPSLWERPEFSANQQNPLFAGLANSVKGIREFGLSLSFMEESMGIEFCVNCVDTQSALGLWTVAQGGLGMAQLAMSQEGRQAPSILSRIKTQAVEQNVFVRVEVLPKDFDEFETQLGLSSRSPRTGSPKVESTSESDPFIGGKSPDFETNLLNGEKFKLSEQKGKVVVLDFWATWCGPCVRALPELIDATSGFATDEVILVAINQGETKKKISQFLKTKKLSGLITALDKNQNIGKSFNVKGIPKTFVLDKEGIVRYSHSGYSSGLSSRLKKEISKLIK